MNDLDRRGGDKKVEIELKGTVYSVYYNTDDNSVETGGNCYYCGAAGAIHSGGIPEVIEVRNDYKTLSSRSPLFRQIAKIARERFGPLEVRHRCGKSSCVKKYSEDYKALFA